MGSDDYEERRRQQREDDRREEDRRRQQREDERREENRRQQRQEEERRQQDRRRLAEEDDRRRLERLDREKSEALWEARHRGDEATVRQILGVPSPPPRAPTSGGEGPPPSRDTRRAVPEVDFSYHQRALVKCLEAATAELPPQRLGNWAARVERLDILHPKEARAELEAIEKEYREAAGWTPSATVDAIGVEIMQLSTLLLMAIHR